MSYAGTIAVNVVNEAGSANLPGKTGGPYDAYRHLLLAAELTRIYGADAAIQILEYHEWEGLIRDHQPQEQEDMDEHNNEIGVEIGKSARSWEEIVERAREALNQSIGSGVEPDGPAVWLPPNQWDDGSRSDPLTPSTVNWPTNDDGRAAPIWPDGPYLKNGVIPDLEPGYNFGDGPLGVTNEFRIPLPEFFAYFRDIGHWWAKNLPIYLHELWQKALNWLPVRDPLALDLDGDGIETVGQNGSVLFDHNGGNLVNGTGWVKGDDGFLVLDRNNNGLIDNGGELFGVDTVMSTGHKANSGFQALADMDSNHDGKIDANDTVFADLRVWKDANQNAITDAGELHTLAELNIASINVTASGGITSLGNGNSTSGSASYTRTDGSTGTAYNLDLAINAYQREYRDDLPIPAALADLPNMAGTGRVHDLIQAAIRDPILAAKLAAFSAGTSRDAQMALLKDLVDSWGNTSDMLSSVDEAKDRHDAVLVYDIAGIPLHSPAMQVDFTSSDPAYVSGSSAVAYGNAYLYELTHNQSPEYQSWIAMLGVLEKFNGQDFFNIPDAPPANVLITARVTAPSSSGSGSNTVTLENTQVRIFEPSISGAQKALMERSYAELLEGVYGALVVQTRLKPYMDAITLSLTDNALALDFSGMAQMLNDKRTTDVNGALLDLLEINRYAGNDLYVQGWQGLDMVAAWLNETPITPEITAILQEMDTVKADRYYGEKWYEPDNLKNEMVIGNAQDNYFIGKEGHDKLWGGAGADYLSGDNGNDYLSGGTENDQLQGRAGDDILDGGAGNDEMFGGDGSDTYVFNQGDGMDIIQNRSYESRDPNMESRDVLMLGAGINPDDVTLTRSLDGYSSLVLALGGGDEIKVRNFFQWDATAGWVLDEIRFANGVAWNTADIKLLALRGDASNQTLMGYGSDDSIDGAGGRDVIYGWGGNDLLHGGSDVDLLFAGDGDDILHGDAGNDILWGQVGNDVITGGVGDDELKGDEGSDIYYFNLGDGNDTINDNDLAANKIDLLQFGEGITASQLTLHRQRDSLVMSIAGTTDSVTVSYYFNSDDALNGRTLNEIRFADGSLLDLATIKNAVLTGTAGDDNIAGYSSDDTIIGLAGNDYLYGRSGNDGIDGGAGDDFLYGEAGNDTLKGGSGSNYLYGGSGDDVLEGGSYLSFIYGEAGNDTLKSGTGYSILFGGAGGDTYYVQSMNSTVVETGNDTDTVIFAANLQGRTYALAEGVEQLLINQVGTGGAFLGNAADNLIRVAGQGQPSLTIEAGAGNDTLVIDTPALTDAITFRFGQGFGQDTLTGSSTVQFTFTQPTDLAAAVTGTALTLTMGADSLTITDFFVEGISYSLQFQGPNNTVEPLTLAEIQSLLNPSTLITGAEGADVFYGAAGIDQYDGLGGDDTIFGSEGDDVLKGSDGNDTVYGELGNDSLYGGAGDDTLIGGEGSNHLDGGDGNDVYVVGSASDVIVEAVGGGYDAVQSSVSLTLADNVEALSLLGSAGLNGIGNALDNIITGNAENNILDGGDGNDTLTGGGFDDHLEGGKGNDILFGDGIGVTNEGNDLLFGGEGDDSLQGNGGDRWVGSTGIRLENGQAQPRSQGATLLAQGLHDTAANAESTTGWARFAVPYASLAPTSNANPDAITSVLYQISPTRFATFSTLHYAYGTNFIGDDDLIERGAGDDSGAPDCGLYAYTALKLAA